MMLSCSTISRVVVLAGAMAVPLAAQGAAPPRTAKPFSDTFTRDASLNPKWTLVEPNAAAGSSLSKKGFLLDGSGQNGGSDLWLYTNYNASLLLQPIVASLNYTVVTKIAFQVTNSYMGAGLVLTQQTGGFDSSSVFHRFEYGDNPQPGIEGFTNGNRDPDYIAFGGKLVYLKLQKAGTTYTYSYSTDGKTWTLVSTVTDTNAYTYIGLISVRQPYDGQTGVDSKPEFSYFKIKATAG